MLAFFLALSLITLPANAGDASGGKRLIQLDNYSKAWMTEDEVLSLMLERHRPGHVGGFIDITDYPEEYDSDAFSRFLYFDRTPGHQEEVNKLLPELSAANIISSIETLSVIQNRYYKGTLGLQAARWIYDRFVEYASNRTDVTVELVQHSFAQPSVVARVTGNGPHSGETLIVGGHEDSLSGWGGNANMRAPGADDNASGVATVLEVFRVIAQSGFKPDRTVEFIAFAGEEAGLLGSQAIAQAYKKDNRQIAGMFNLDMTMFPGTEKNIAFVTDNADPYLTSFVKMLIDEYVKIPWVNTRCGYGCSDHASWTRAGYPSVYPFEAPDKEYNPHIHTTDDTLKWLDTDFGMHYAKLALAYAIEVGLTNELYYPIRFLRPTP